MYVRVAGRATGYQAYAHCRRRRVTQCGVHCMIDTVFFDFGGTLFFQKRVVPEDETLMCGYQALTERGMELGFDQFKAVFKPALEAEEERLARDGLEIDLRAFCRQMMPRLGLEPKEEIVDAHLWGRFKPHRGNDEIFDDVVPTLSRLKPHTKIGLISNAQPLGILWYLDRTGIASYFDEVIISGGVGVKKPNPRIFHLAAESICSDPSACIMVGDDPWGDVGGAESAGMIGLMVDRSGRFRNSFPGVKFIYSLREVLGWVGGT